MRALLFGTFNPPTCAHMDMGRAAKEALGINERDVVYIPTGDQYIKSWKGYTPGSIMPAEKRLALLHVAAAQHGFMVSAIEVDGVTDGKTYNGVKHFGFEESILCLGIDNIAQMKKWYRWEELVRRTRLLIFHREGYTETPEAQEVLQNARRVEYTRLWQDNDGISSTQVRELYKQGDFEKLKCLVPEPVYKYLSENDRVFF